MMVCWWPDGPVSLCNHGGWMFWNQFGASEVIVHKMSPHTASAAAGWGKLSAFTFGSFKLRFWLLSKLQRCRLYSLPIIFFTFPASFCNILRNFRIYPSILPLWSFRDQYRVECIIWYWNTVAEWMGDTMQWIAGHASNNVGSCWIQPAIHNGNWNLVHPWSRPQLNSML